MKQKVVQYHGLETDKKNGCCKVFPEQKVSITVQSLGLEEKRVGIIGQA